MYLDYIVLLAFTWIWALSFSLFIAFPPRLLFPVVGEKRGVNSLRGRHGAVLKEDVQTASLLLPLQRRAHHH